MAKPTRSAAYLNWIRSWPCAVCQKKWRSEAAHMGPHGMSQKASDFSAIPLCAECHRTDKRSYHANAKAFLRRWPVEYWIELYNRRYKEFISGDAI